MGSLTRKQRNVATELGRVLDGFVYPSRQARDAALAAKLSVRGSSAPPRRRKANTVGALVSTISGVSGSDVVSTKGWKSSVREEVAKISSADGAKQWRRCLLHKGDDYPPEFSAGQRDDIKIQGLRLCVTLPLGHRIRWAVCLTKNNAALGKTVEEVAKVAGSVVSHEVDVVEKWYTLPLTGIAVMAHTGQVGEVTNNIYLSVEQTKTTEAAAHVQSTFKFVATVLTPGGQEQTHEL